MYIFERVVEEKHRSIVGQLIDSDVFQMYKLVVLFLILTVSVVDANDDEFLDVAVQLRGDRQDELVADLIAGEKNAFNGGHVSGVCLVFPTDSTRFGSLDSWCECLSFSCSNASRSTSETRPRSNDRRFTTRRSSNAERVRSKFFHREFRFSSSRSNSSPLAKRWNERNANSSTRTISKNCTEIIEIGNIID